MSDLYVEMLGNWFNGELEAAFERAKPNNLRLCLGCVVWGERYVRRMLDYCIPSLLAPGNLPYLASVGDDIWLVIHTDGASFELFREDPGIKRLAEMGICIEIRGIPQEIIDDTPAVLENKYRLIGGAHNLHMKQAKYLRYGYHMLMPDHVYSENYFFGIRARAMAGFDAVVHGGLSVDISKAAAELESEDGVLQRSARAINGIGWKHLHRLFKPFIMNGRDYKTNCPVHSYMLFASKGRVHILSPHHSIAYLSHAALMRGPIRLFNTIDSQLPYFISEGMKVCVPFPEEDMSYIEISDPDKQMGTTVPPNDFMMFCVQFWMSNRCEPGFLRYFNLDNMLRLPDDFQHEIEPMTENEIGLIKDAVRKGVRKNRELCMKAIKPEFQTDPIKDRAA